MSSPKHVRWQKSSFSGQGNNCVELAHCRGSETVLVRESDEPAVVLSSSRERLESLLSAVRNGKLEL